MILKEICDTIGWLSKKQKKETKETKETKEKNETCNKRIHKKINRLNFFTPV